MYKNKNERPAVYALFPCKLKFRSSHLFKVNNVNIKMVKKTKLYRIRGSQWIKNKLFACGCLNNLIKWK